MFKCRCGSTEFSAHQILRVDIIVDGDNQFIRNYNETDDSLAIYDAETPYGPYVCNTCAQEYDELNHTIEIDENIEKEPYLKTKRMVYKYNPKYGNNRICFCGHTYERHFDSYEEMCAIGCKYCRCNQFVERTEENRSFDNVCRLCGNNTFDEHTIICSKCANEFKF